MIDDQWFKEQMGNILNSFTGPLNRAETALWGQWMFRAWPDLPFD